MQVRHALSVAVLLGLSAALLWWLNESVPTGAGGRKVAGEGVVTLAVEEPDDLNPLATQHALVRRWVLGWTHDTLMDFDPVSGELRERAAVDVEEEDGGFSFAVRPGLVFSDGREATVGDVLFAWEVHRDGEVAAPAFDRVERVEVIAADDGRARVRVVSKEPGAFDLRAVATRWPVLSRPWFEAQGRAGVRPGDVREPGPGTGPYRLEAWRRGQDLRLVRHEASWWRRVRPDRWRLDGLELRFVTGAAARLSLLHTGTLDWYAIPEAEALLEEHPDLAPRYRPVAYDHRRLGHYMIAWNCGRPPTDDARVRRALTMLTDRRTVVTGLLGGHGAVAASPFEPGHPMAAELPPLPFDPGGARDLLADAGIGPDRPVDLEILVPAEGSLYRRMLELIEPGWRQAGFRVTLTSLPFAALMERVGDRSFSGVILHFGHARGWVDPYLRYHSSQAGGTGQNLMGWRHEEVDRLLERARHERDPDRRRQAYARFQHILREHQPGTMIAYSRATGLIARSLRGTDPGPLGMSPELWSRE